MFNSFGGAFYLGFGPETKQEVSGRFKPTTIVPQPGKKDANWDDSKVWDDTKTWEE